MKHLVAPSILSADFGKLKEAVELLNESDADWIHCDIMDGRFVPNISFGLPVLEAIKKYAKKPLDVHLMIVEPEKYISAFRNAGADILTVHQEACIHLDRTVAEIKEAGMQAGVAINPATSIETLTHVLGNIDLALLMSVNPGFGGQHFIPYVLHKVQSLYTILRVRALNVKIEVDGGVSFENAESLLEAGASVLVAGSAVFKAPNPKAMIASLKAVSASLPE